jgi:TonB family protein
MCLTFSLLLAAAHRLPAPIVETPDQSPAAEQPAKRKSQHRTYSQEKTAATTRSTPAPLQGPARFAGAWSGKINQGLLGHVIGTFTISSDATSVQVSQNMGGGTHEATVSGDTISWNTGILGSSAILTLNNDGQTAQLTLKGLLASSTATLHRSSAPVTTAPSNLPANPQTPLSMNSSSANTQGYDTVALRPSGSMSGPKPQLPAEARGQHLTGIGVYTLHFDKPTGNLIDVTVSQSSGSTILDQAAITTLRQWHATPGCPREVPFTITYSVTGP